MKRSIFLAAVATLAAGSALAQSSVTVYGRLNMTAERFRTNTPTTKTTTYLLNNNASRIGFKGFEDLGGGMNASFLMESGFSPDTGAAAATFWGRESWVALGGAFGKVRLGNVGPTSAYFTVPDYISMHNHDTGTSSDAFYLYPGNRLNPARQSNTVAYTSPSLGGLVVDAQVSLSETQQIGRTYVLTANYDAGPLHLGGSFVEAGAGISGTKTKEYGVRGLYELGDLTFGAYYIRNQGNYAYQYGGAATNIRRDAARASVMYAMGPGELHLNVGKAFNVKNFGFSNDDATQITLGYNYNLSKRTKIYTYFTKVNDDRSVYGGAYSTFAGGVRHNF